MDFHYLMPTMRGVFLLSDEKLQETVDEILAKAVGEDQGAFEVSLKPHRDGRWPVQKKDANGGEVWGTFATREEVELAARQWNSEMRSKWEEKVRGSVLKVEAWVHEGLRSGMTQLNNGTSWTWVTVLKNEQEWFHVKKHAGKRHEHEPETGEEFLAFAACLEELKAKLASGDESAAC